MAINFKDVGTLNKPGPGYYAQNRTALPIGIKTPVEVDYSSNTFLAMHTSERAQIADNLRNLIQTNWGERVGIYDFGANLSELTTELTNRDDFETEAAIRINTAVQKWMPYVSLSSMKADFDDETSPEGMARIILDITYSIPIINTQMDRIEVVLVAI
ncbi:MAG: GPW/gp25 family protein [Flavobacteriaceae bacterium]